jgi:hypothetical protein
MIRPSLRRSSPAISDRRQGIVRRLLVRLAMARSTRSPVDARPWWRSTEIARRAAGPCGDDGHRVVPLRFPYPDAEAVRARLVAAVGADRVSRLRATEDGLAIVVCRACARRDDVPAGGAREAMPDTEPPTVPCVDGSHRVLTVTFPYAEALVIRGRLVSALGPDRVSPLRPTEGGWELVICRRCMRAQHAARRAA